ncbi:site-2 protease family protein [Risungbinella massiliensis]|uniref:site-2 protease family protein n=1 Tax=Risungbinella massiliensis TaxID=1329796 RepID=UPI0005CBA5F0|nr:site-2 protease family protein [Risungbinella massiliensis]
MDGLESFLAYPLSQLPFVIIALIIALSLHEFAHAYVAYRFGDPTAHQQGRVTLNPLRHLDPIGTLMIFLVGFGWARPVPVNRFYFRKPRLAGVLVSVAGPLTNLVLCFLFMATYQFSPISNSILDQFFQINIFLNVSLFVFNLIPLPPLDGYRIVEDLLPNRYRAKLSEYEMYGVFVFLLLAITPLGNYVFTPLFNTVVPFIIFNMASILS